MHREGLVHDGIQICVRGIRRHIDFRALTQIRNGLRPNRDYP
jgi:hypothetical protein